MGDQRRRTNYGTVMKCDLEECNLAGQNKHKCSRIKASRPPCLFDFTARLFALQPAFTPVSLVGTRAEQEPITCYLGR